MALCLKMEKCALRLNMARRSHLRRRRGDSYKIVQGIFKKPIQKAVVVGEIVLAIDTTQYRRQQGRLVSFRAFGTS